MGPIFEELQEALCLYISFHLSMQGVEFFKVKVLIAQKTASMGTKDCFHGEFNVFHSRGQGGALGISR